MITLTITVKDTGAKAEWFIVGELPTMSTVKTTSVDGGYACEVSGWEMQSGGILHHLRQQGHFRAPDLTF